MGTDSPEGIKAELSALLRLIRDYAKQETVDPIKNAARYVLFGLIGSILIVVGVFFFSLSGLRRLQQMTAFEGNWSAAPYGIVALVLVLLSGLAVRAIGSRNRANS